MATKKPAVKKPAAKKTAARKTTRAPVRKRNPDSHDEIRKACDLYTRFSGHEAEEAGRVTMPKMPRVAVAIGKLDGVLYTTVRDGKTEKYIHKFKASDAPLLCASPDGKQLLLVGGNYDFTERGIVDRSSKH